MPKAEGYSCDGGCGASVVLERPGATLMSVGWFTCFPPPGSPTLYADSSVCMVRAIERHWGTGDREITTTGGG